ncbi:MAG: pilus assembly protein [Candidatus Promineofilum sp.]|nr:pilus assembly protein [Promineifilum sp.]
MGFSQNKNNRTLIDYALVLVLIAVVLIAVLALLGPYIGEWLNNAAEWIRQLIGS